MGDATEREQVLNVENDWVVAISVDDPEGRTTATARLQFGGRTWVGVGLSRLGAAERGVAGAGGQLAVAGALSDLARHLMTVTDVPATALA
jgi:hypothetical protein